MIQIAKAKPAIGFSDSDTMQAKRAHGRPQLVTRKPVFRIDFRRQRRDLFAGKTLCCIADHVRRFAKGEIKIGEVAHVSGNALRRLQLQLIPASALKC